MSTEQNLDLLVTPEERAFRTRVRKFAEEIIAPEADRIEEEDRFPLDLYREMGRQHMLGLLLPKKLGGDELGPRYIIILGEELAYHCHAIVVIMDCCTFSTIPVYRFGSEEQKSRWLPRMIRGETVGAIAITEPEAGSDAVGSMKTRAEKRGDRYIVNGEKHFITNGSQADMILMFAVTDPKARKEHGISAFIITPDMPGFEVIKDYRLMGMRGMRNSHLRFTNMEVPAENLVGGEGNGARIMMDELDTERIMLAASACGAARSAMDMAVRRADERKQFKSKIREFEAVSFKIADMAIRLNAMRTMTWMGASLIDRKVPASKECASAKVFCTEGAFQIAHESMQICGGLGYTKEMKIERIFRNLRVFSILGGTNEILRYLIQRDVFLRYHG